MLVMNKTIFELEGGLFFYLLSTKLVIKNKKQQLLCKKIKYLHKSKYFRIDLIQTALELL